MLSIPQNNLNRCCYECVYLIIFHGSTITGAVISDFVLQWSRGISFYHASIQHHSSPLNRFSKNEDKITKQQIKQLSQTFIFMPCWIIKSGGCWIYNLVQVLFCRKLKIEMLVQLEIDVKILFFLFFLICSSTDRIGKKKSMLYLSPWKCSYGFLSVDTRVTNGSFTITSRCMYI